MVKKKHKQGKIYPSVGLNLISQKVSRLDMTEFANTLLSYLVYKQHCFLILSNFDKHDKTQLSAKV